MKKYIKPVIDTTEVSTVSMMCLSKNDKLGNGIQLSKNRNIDDEEEEEEIEW